MSPAFVIADSATRARSDCIGPGLSSEALPVTLDSRKHRFMMATWRIRMNANIAPDRAQLAASTFLSRSHQLLIGGKWVPAAGGATLDVFDPATAKVLAKVAAG